MSFGSGLSSMFSYLINSTTPGRHNLVLMPSRLGRTDGLNQRVNPVTNDLEDHDEAFAKRSSWKVSMGQDYPRYFVSWELFAALTMSFRSRRCRWHPWCRSSGRVHL